MGKILAIILALWLILVGYRHIVAYEWIAPTALPPGWWGLAQAPEYKYLSEPATGYGWFRFDVWNSGSPATGRPVYKNDFKIRF